MNDTDMFDQSIKNPYASRLKQSITICLNPETISYCTMVSKESEIPYQTLIDYFLSQCAKKKSRRLWKLTSNWQLRSKTCPRRLI